ncbi:MAG: hypothetical protein N3A69_02800 [Leptospiraceae bacterium]|nr:hypothetical protein [Leptospiraceae bacterium]
MDKDFAYIVDTKSDVRANPKIAGTTHNVFGIQTGVAIFFLVREKSKRRKRECRIEYTFLDDFMPRETKLMWLATSKILQMPFELLQPDKKSNWINISKTNFRKLRPVFDKKSKKSIFKFCSLGVSTNRDEWVYDRKKSTLIKKIKYFIKTYNSISIPKDYKGRIEDLLDYSIKWSRDLKKKLSSNRKMKFSQNKICISFYRPFTQRFFYADKILADMLTENHYTIFGKNLNSPNKVIVFSGIASNKPFQVFSTTCLVDLHFLGDARLLPLLLYDERGVPTYNISIEVVQEFQEHYKNKKINQEDIFLYVYAVLNNPNYQKEYVLDLKQEFPRIPFYKDFNKWRTWGKRLFYLHTEYEKIRAYNIKVVHEKEKKETPKPKLRALKEEGTILLDENTKLVGIPQEAWKYKLGNRSAIEWVLDQAKEREPNESELLSKFYDYKFSEYKQETIELLGKVCALSVETIQIFQEMEKEKEE